MEGLPVELQMRTCANGETVECFLTVGGRPVYGPGGVGAFVSKPTPQEALRAALRVAMKGEEVAVPCG